MNYINLGKNIMKFRLQLSMTQDQLAKYAGVSKSAVSKWETGMTYPDILLLPQLATLFNISVDELIGYQPQLNKNDISKIYRELSKEISEGKQELVLDKIQVYTKKYFACFPFLLQIVIFYINHHTLYEHGKELLAEALKLCCRIQNESNDPELAKEALTMKGIIFTILNRPQDVLSLFGEQIKPIKNDADLIASAYQQLGNLKRAQEIKQISMYQHLLSLILDGTSYLMLQGEDFHTQEETIKRLLGVIDLFEVDRLHPNTSLQLYFGAATLYVSRGETEKTFKMLRNYLETCKNLVADFSLHGDRYFDCVQEWLEGLDLGTEPPRNITLVKKSLVEALSKNPAFTPLHEEPEFQLLLREFEHLEGGI